MSNRFRRHCMLVLSTILSALFVAAPLQAENCNASIGSIGMMPIVQYDPFRSGPASATLNIQLVLTGDNCDLALSSAGLAPGAGRTMVNGGKPLIYRLFHGGVELANDPDGFVPLRLSGAANDLVSLRIEVPGGQIGPAGTYTDQLSLRLVDRNAGNARMGPDVSANVTAAMEARAEVNIAGSSAGSAFSAFGVERLDLGSLKQGLSKSALVQIRSTAPVRISVSSDNGGALRRVGGLEKLSYDLSIDSERLELGGGAGAVQRGASPSLTGTHYPLEVRIVGNPDALPAGEYQDLITIDVMAE